MRRRIHWRIWFDGFWFGFTLATLIAIAVNAALLLAVS